MHRLTINDVAELVVCVFYTGSLSRTIFKEDRTELNDMQLLLCFVTLVDGRRRSDMRVTFRLVAGTKATTEAWLVGWLVGWSLTSARIRLYQR